MTSPVWFKLSIVELNINVILGLRSYICTL